MNALLVFRPDAAPFGPWREGFACPQLLPVANRTVAEYQLAFAIALGARRIRVVAPGARAAVERVLGDGTRWGVTIEYALGTEDDDARTTAVRNRGFLREPAIILDLAGIPLAAPAAWRDGADADSVVDNDGLPTANVLLAPEGWATGVAYEEFRAAHARLLPFVPVEDVKSWFEANMRFSVETPDPYVRPGYGAEPGIAIGHDVSLPSSAVIAGPAVIGDHVRVGRDVTIGSGVVIGDNACVAPETALARAVVLPGTYVGEGLEVVGRIVGPDRIIDVATGQVAVIQDPVLVGRTAPSGPQDANEFVERCAAAAIAAATLPAYVALRPFVRAVPRTLLGADGVVIPGTRYARGAGGALAFAAFRALRLDRWTLLARAAGGRLALVGHRPRPATSAGRDETHALGRYRPAAFSPADTPGVLPDQAAMEESVHAATRSTWSDLRVAALALLHGPAAVAARESGRFEVAA